jgi:hypothetical protein
METYKFFLFCFFLSFTITPATFAQTAQFEQSFIFSDEFNNTQELIIGYDPFGSNGLDPDLGEVIIPQVPPEEFGVRFQLPIDTSLTTLKDIRFGCGWPAHFEHLIDLSYLTGSSTIEINWNWLWPTWYLYFINPANGDTLAILENNFDPPYFSIPSSLDKIRIDVFYDGPLSWPDFILFSPNGGEIIEGGNNYLITWYHNGQIPFMNIDFSADSGNNWILIADSVISTQNSYNWLVPNINSESCLIRIGDFPCAYNQSDSVFTITYPVSTKTEEKLPTEFSLEQNYPNPFNPKTSIQYAVGSGQFVTLKVYDVLGNEIATLVNEEKPAGSYDAEFYAEGLTSGIYFYELMAGEYSNVKKMLLLK